MAGATFFHDRLVPRCCLHSRDLMGSVTIDTDSGGLVARLHGFPVNAPGISAQHARMAVSARTRNIGAIHLGCWISFRKNVMTTVATGAVGSDQQTALTDGAAVYGVHEQLISIGDRNAVFLGQLGISMAGAASSRKRQRINSGCRVFHGLDGVRGAVAVL